MIIILDWKKNTNDIKDFGSELNVVELTSIVSDNFENPERIETRKFHKFSKRCLNVLSQDDSNTLLYFCIGFLGMSHSCSQCVYLLHSFYEK